VLLLPWQVLDGATVLPVQLETVTGAGLPVQPLAGAPVQLLLATTRLPWHEPRSRPNDGASPPVLAAIIRTIVYIAFLLPDPGTITTPKSGPPAAQHWATWKGRSITFRC